MPRGPDEPFLTIHRNRESRVRNPAFQRALASSQAQTLDRVNVPALPVRRRKNSFCTARFLHNADLGSRQSSVEPVVHPQANEFLDLPLRNGNLRQPHIDAASPSRQPRIGRIHCAAQYPFPPYTVPLPSHGSQKGSNPKRVQRNGRKSTRKKTMPSNANRSRIQSRISLRNFLSLCALCVNALDLVLVLFSDYARCARRRRGRWARHRSWKSRPAPTALRI